MRRRGGGGFTLVEVLIVVAIIGLLAAIAIPAFTRYVRKARTAEAAEQLNRLWLGSVTYYETDHPDGSGGLRPRQFPGPSAVWATGSDCGCLPSGRCPGGAPAWNTDVWTALTFSMADAHSYLPGYTAVGTGSAAQFTALTRGDLDCDGVIATFERRGGIHPNTGDVTGQAQPVVTNELE